ncbi:MAG: hypothetical protein BWX90_00212 [bacterium ADurb.Bin132]|nr:MAG: hypothetical protein BWX90_00212 [bacterium ADurb.Bin132]
MERLELFDVFDSYCPLDGFAFLVFYLVPDGLFKFDAQIVKLAFKDFIESFLCILFYDCNAIPQAGKVLSIGCCMPEAFYLPVFLIKDFLVGFSEKVFVSVLKLYIINSHKPYQGIAWQYVEVNVWQRLKL